MIYSDAALVFVMMPLTLLYPCQIIVIDKLIQLGIYGR